MSTQPLTNTELAKSGLDLTSWVLQDDLYQQDFCYGAKETDSPSAGLPELAMEGLSTDLLGANGLSLDEPFKLEDCFPQSLKEQLPAEDFILPAEGLTLSADTEVIIQDEPLDLQELMREEILQQQKLQQLEFFKQKEEEEIQREQEYQRQQHQLELLSILREQKELQMQHRKDKEQAELRRQQLLQTYSTQPYDTMEVLYDDQNVGSPQKCIVSTVSSPYYGSPIQGYESDMEESSNGPCIISVPVSEAYLTPTESGSSIKLPSVQYSSRPIIEISENDPFEIKYETPKPFCITVKKLSIPSTQGGGFMQAQSSSHQSSSSAAKSAKTLKEALENNDADDFIRELIGSDSQEDEVKNCLVLGESWTESEQSDSGSSMMSPASDYPESPALKSSRCHPYSTIERKLRKKEQNKRAALRYRQKKKDEEDSVSAQLNRELECQKKLIERYESVRMEVKLMKKLAREMLVAQGKLEK